MPKQLPIGLQLYSVRKDCERDFPAVLKAVAKMGYQGVEFAGYHNRPAKELRTMLDDLGLKCCGTHTGLASLQGDQLAQTVEFNQILGNPYLIVPWLPDELRKTAADWHKLAAAFNAIAEKLTPFAMYVGYHNHNFEFTPLDGQLPWDILFSNTRPEVLTQLDTGNALHGGADPAALLARYPGRARTVHLKEFSKTNPSALITEGDVRWPEIFKLCETIGATQWYIVEYEHAAYPPLQAVDLCLQKLRALGL